jgi:hypothetical protein
MMEANNDGWIEWRGGDCPVPDGTLVDIRMRSGEIALALPANQIAKGRNPDASYAFWENEGSSADIVAYRLHYGGCIEREGVMSDFKLQALRAIEHTSLTRTASATQLARALWPEKLKLCGTSRRRVALARGAGGYFSKLLKEGLCHWHQDDFDRGYYISEKGREYLRNPK